MMIERKPDNI